MTDLHTLFRSHARERPLHPAVVDDRGALDYARLEVEVRGLAGVLTARGVAPGDVVGIRLPNGRDAVIAELAVAAVGAAALAFEGGRPCGLAAVLGDECAPGVITPSARCRAWTPVAVDPVTTARIVVGTAPVGYSHLAIGGRAEHRSPTARHLVLEPLATSFGAAITLCRFGGTLILTAHRDTASVTRLVAEHRPTHVFGRPLPRDDW
ncbi:AMP-binding protein [Actinosynnema sp. NPDC020468]|uniref:AMP-binding protein n=1 Tax=Actinosynnema sp. NPDC020468 TaxID=3154488 RepID=UPI0033FB45C7